MPLTIWQKPIEGPIPADVLAPGRPRNILDDPFSVRSNRETIAGELLLTFDPTPGTWMYEWDNDRAEDAKFAISADFVYRHYQLHKMQLLVYWEMEEQHLFFPELHLRRIYGKPIPASYLN